MSDVTRTPSRRERQRADTISEIKTAARELLVESGPSGVSLRAVARHIGLSAPALYRYFPNLEALVVAVCVDLYEELRTHMETRFQQLAADNPLGQLLVAARSFRGWAVDHRAEFSLMFASLLPGTVIANPGCAIAHGDTEQHEALRRFCQVFGERITDVYRQPENERGFEMRVPPAPEMSPELHDEIQRCGEAIGLDVPFDVQYAFHSYWVRLYGLVAMEVFHQLPVTEYAGEYFETEMSEMASRLGVSLREIET